MLLYTNKLEDTFRKVRQIQEEMQTYCIAPDRDKLSVEDLHRVIEQMYSIKIEKIEVAFEGAFVRGLVERYEGRARILVRKDQEEDWLRFTSVKELCQIAISEKEDWSVDGTKTLDLLLYEDRLDHENTEPQPRTAAPHPIQSERLAQIAAIELMYPFEYRLLDKKALNEATTTLRALAVHFHVPEYVIGTALNPRRIAMCSECWAKIGGPYTRAS